MTIKFGLHNSAFLPVSGKAEDIYPELRDRAQWLDANGFTYMSVMDHLWQIPGVGAPEDPFLEGWMTLAAVADATKRLQLTTMVTSVGYRNPALVAKMVTTLDIISGGRAILGMGAGWYEAEYQGYGYTFPRPGIRLRQLREAIQIVKTMWERPRATFEGKYFVVRDAVLEPKPLQKPRPRILIGGGGEQVTLRIAAQEADMWNVPGAAPDVFARKAGILKRYANEAGRDIRRIELTKTDRLCLAPTRERAEDKWKARGAPPAAYRGIVGTPEDAIVAIRHLEGVGMQGIFLSMPNADAETRDLLAKEVIPAFA